MGARFIKTCWNNFQLEGIYIRPLTYPNVSHGAELKWEKYIILGDVFEDELDGFIQHNICCDSLRHSWRIDSQNINLWTLNSLG